MKAFETWPLDSFQKIFIIRINIFFILWNIGFFYFQFKKYSKMY